MFPFVYKINFFGWIHLFYFGLLIPVLAVHYRGRLADIKKPLPNRLRHFQKTTFSVALLGLVSLLTARVQWIELFPRAIPPWKALIAGAIMYPALVALMHPLWRRAVSRRTRIVHLFMPANATERAWWIVVAISAGVFEEITWRGVQAGLVGNLTRSLLLAALVCAACFGLAHANQGWLSVAIVAGLGLGFHALVWLSGSLYVAMAVHIAYDITAGVSYGRLGKELGYNLDPDTELTSPAP